MPKKRHPTKFTKPQSTPPASLASSRSRNAHDDANHVRGVNEILADLRRTRVSTSGDPQGGAGIADTATTAAALAAVHPSPSVPPSLRRILQLPEPVAPPPPPRSRRVLDARGRRLPPGPLPPRSWLADSRHAPRRPRTPGSAGADLVLGVDYSFRAMPGAYSPDRGTLVDTTLAVLAADWDYQRHYNKYWLGTLPDHLRTALIAYVGAWSHKGLSAADLKALLQPPAQEVEEHPGIAARFNDGMFVLDLMGSLGKSLELKEVSELLFGRRSQQQQQQQHQEPAAMDPNVLHESWDAMPELPAAAPQLLLPNLTRLSLAVSPQNSRKMSWRQLLSFSTHVPTLTHLSLAYWPDPTLTPNAIAAVVDSPRGAVQYGGTGFYSHSLDDDWFEAVTVLRRLSRNLYCLEHLDLTGCNGWAPALMRRGEHDPVDWIGAWGKVSTLLLHRGFKTPESEQVAETNGFLESIAVAAQIERHIAAQRSGRGRFIEVLRDKLPETQL